MLYPLKFQPVFKFYPYGGRRFAQVLEMDVPHDRDIAEAWQVSDRGQDQSVVANGPLMGRTLRSLMEEFQAELVGAEVWTKTGDYFPLLVKFLDCDKRLPAHMHPGDETARALHIDRAGKTEAWYIVRADATAEAYCGAKSGLTAADFSAAIASGDAYEGVMKRIPTRTGDTFLVPSGRLHALDSGNLVFEIQQNSDAGFGWDWAGFIEAGVISPADAHSHKALAVQHASFEDGTQEQTREMTLLEDDDERTLCCACRYFVLERLKIRGKTGFGDTVSRFNTLTLINGAAIFSAGGEEVFAKRGETLLIPAGVQVAIAPNSLTNGGEVEILRCYVPDLERDVVDFLRASGIDDTSIAMLGSYGKSNDLLPLLNLPQDLFDVSADQRHGAAIEHRASDVGGGN